LGRKGSRKFLRGGLDIDSADLSDTLFAGGDTFMPRTRMRSLISAITSQMMGSSVSTADMSQETNGALALLIPK
jgi:hypothetical protein